MDPIQNMNGGPAAARKRFYAVSTTVSAAMFCLIVAAWLFAGGIKQSIRIAPGVYVGLTAFGGDVRLAVFSSPEGPYRGSIISFDGAPNQPVVSGFGSRFGIYYRMIRWPDGFSMWSLLISLAYPLVLTAILPAAWILQREPWKAEKFVRE